MSNKWNIVPDKVQLQKIDPFGIVKSVENSDEGLVVELTTKPLSMLRNARMKRQQALLGLMMEGTDPQVAHAKTRSLETVNGVCYADMWMNYDSDDNKIVLTSEAFWRELMNARQTGVRSSSAQLPSYITGNSPIIEIVTGINEDGIPEILRIFVDGKDTTDRSYVLAGLTSAYPLTRMKFNAGDTEYRIYYVENHVYPSGKSANGYSIYTASGETVQEFTITRPTLAQKVSAIISGEHDESHVRKVSQWFHNTVTANTSE